MPLASPDRIRCDVKIATSESAMIGNPNSVNSRLYFHLEAKLQSGARYVPIGQLRGLWVETGFTVLPSFE